MVPLLLLLAACSDEDQPPSTATPSEQPSATATGPTPPGATQTPSGAWHLPAIGRVKVLPLAVAEDRDLPSDVLLYFHTSCYACDAGTADLYRGYRDASGTLRIEELLTSGPGFLSVVRVSPNGSPILAGSCDEPQCYLVSFGEARTLTLFRSDDGGMTVRRLGQISPIDSVPLFVAGDDVVIMDSDRSGGKARFRLLNSGEPLLPPTSLQQVQAFPQRWPGPDSRIFWIASAPGGRGGTLWYDAAGNLVVGEVDAAVSSTLWFAANDGSRYLTGFEKGVSGPVQTSYLMVTSSGGQLREAFAYRGYDLRVHAEIAPRLLLGTALIQTDDNPTGFRGGKADFRLILVDLDRRTIHRVPGFAPGPGFEPNLYTFPSAVALGPFLRVSVGAGDCLNLREGPAVSSAVVVCSVDGVLLRERRGAHTTDGWLGVATPDGRDGFVRQEFVQR